jgi:2-polyprenyl-3-methyl-5-hydroxy-6-metoxy-1,4-benzoquinol methylase
MIHPESQKKDNSAQRLSGRWDAPEWMDEPTQPVSDLHASLRDIRWVNRFLGGTSVTLGHLKRRLRNHSREKPVTLLDLATGSADIPRAIVRWGRRNGGRFRVCCMDFNPNVLDAARRESAGYPELEFVRGDAREIEGEDRSYDWVTCNMALHHFGPEEAAQILREMDRVSRVGFIVNDLRRSRWAWLGIWLLTRLLPANRLTRHDGPLSTLRAYTPAELRRLAEVAGLTGAKVFTHLFSRMALVVEKDVDRS